MKNEHKYKIYIRSKEKECHNELVGGEEGRGWEGGVLVNIMGDNV